MSIRAICILSLSLFLCSCADLPRDPRESTRSVVETGRLRVGLIENPPWVIRTTGEPAGAEVEMIRQFAASMGAKPEWHWGGDETLFPALEKYQLDVVAGGITSKTPWTSRIGITSSYYTEKYDIGTAAGAEKVKDIRGQPVAVGKDVHIAALISEKKGLPLQTVPGPTDKLVAGPTWKIEKLGMTPAGQNLLTEDHVLAVGPGENQMIKRLDEFFSKKTDQVTQLLSEQPEAGQ